MIGVIDVGIKKIISVKIGISCNNYPDYCVSMLCYQLSLKLVATLITFENENRNS